MSSESQPDHYDWSHLPSDLLNAIATHLTLYSDYIRLRYVCFAWRSSLPSSPFHPLPCQLPFLLLPPPPPTTDTLLYNLLTRKVNALPRPLPLPEASYERRICGSSNDCPLPEVSYPRRICGSSHGWLVLAGDSPEVLALNPLTGAKLILPPLSALPCVVGFSYANVGREYSLRDATSGEIYAIDLRQMRDETLRKVILSNSPSPSNTFIAVGIVGSNLTATSELVFYENGWRGCEFQRLGNSNSNTWKSVPGLGLGSGFYAEDVIYSNGQFYAVNKSGDVAVFNLDDDDNSHTLKIIRTVDTIPGDLLYLVIADGELFLISRKLEAEADIVNYCEVYQTTAFDVYKFRKVENGGACWDRVTDLGDRVAFVGGNSSLALSASNFPGLRGNCIYFTDDHSKSNDVGVFDLGRNCIEPLLPCYNPNSSSTWPLFWASPIWVTPNPC